MRTKINQKNNPKRGLNFSSIDRKNPALFIVSNYILTCKKCSPTDICMRHHHIPFCINTGPCLNPKARVTKNGPDRMNQRLFRQNLKNLIYQYPEKNFMDSYQETKKIVFQDMPQNYAETFGICTDLERRVYDHIFSHKCKFPLDITSDSHMITYCHFQNRVSQTEEFRHERNGNVYFFVPSLLKMLEHETFIMDGTFSPIRHLPYIQCYILSQYIRIGNKSFTMPIMYIYMPKRTIASFIYYPIYE